MSNNRGLSRCGPRGGRGRGGHQKDRGRHQSGDRRDLCDYPDGRDSEGYQDRGEYQDDLIDQGEYSRNRNGYSGGHGSRGGHRGGHLDLGGYQNDLAPFNGDFARSSDDCNGYRSGHGRRADRSHGHGEYSDGVGRDDEYSGDLEGLVNDCPMPNPETHKVLMPQLMTRGTAGTTIELLANYYKIDTSDIVVYHYEVDITKLAVDPESSDPPVELKKPTEGFLRLLSKFSKHIFDTFVKNNPNVFKDVPYVYDGMKSLYTSKRLPFEDTQAFVVKVDIDGGRSGNFRVKVKQVDRVDLTKLVDFYKRKNNSISKQAVAIFETAFRFICGQAYTGYKQNMFFSLDLQEPSQYVTWPSFVRGFISSVRITEFGLALNVDLKTACTISRSFEMLPDLVAAVAGVRNLETDVLSELQVAEVNKIIRSLKVITKHTFTRIFYTIDRLVLDTPQTTTFVHKDGTVVSIADYFKRNYKISLKSYPMIMTSGKKRYLPLEVCFLMDKQFLSHSKINDTLQNELLQKSTNPPNVYFNKLNAIVSKVTKLNPELQGAFGIKEICANPVLLTGRVLPTPKTVEGPKQTFFKPGKTPTKWGVYCLDSYAKPDELSAFVKSMHQRAEQLGLRLGAIPYPNAIVDIKSVNDIKKGIFGNLNDKTNCELIFVGIPTRHSIVNPSLMYNLIKHYCDQTYGIISCCFKAEHITNPPNGYFDNFLLKVNGKIGGQNLILQPSQLDSLPFKVDRTMLVGVDVNHPGATEKVLSSISAAVGSYDSMFTKYMAAIRVQRKERDEMVKQLDSMIEELLNEYKKYNAEAYPDNLFIFRDGVSEGQFENIENLEIPLIEAVFKKVKKQMKLTFVVVQKRHHTRFVRMTADTSGGKPMFNVPGGTVVDQSIVEPTYSVFYLNSHFSPLGTSKPTKYIIIRDDLKLTPDVMQKFVYFACHNCIRTNKVIRFPTPVRYADLCAFRSKLHIEGQRELATIDPNQAEQEEEKIISKLNGWVKIHEKVRNRLYYC